jgi:sugar phosphate isomerase/epimerase
MWSLGFEKARPASPLTATGLLTEAHRLGVEVVQFGPNHGLQSMTAADRAEVVRLAGELGLELECGTAGLDPGHLTEMARLARSCGARLLRTVPAERPGLSRMTPAETEAALRQTLPVLAGESVVLAIENALIPARTLRSILESIGHPLLGITLDTVNSLAISEGVREVAEVLAPFVRCFHVKDYAVTREWHSMGFRVEGRPAGQGQLDIPWIINLLRESGASGNAILELWPPPQAELEETVALERQWVEQSVRYLRTLIPTHV